MTVAERSKYQQKIIKNYYDNREAISLQRLSELVTELYLAEGKARQTAVEEHRRRAGEAEGPGLADRAPGQAGQPGPGGQAGRRTAGQEVTAASPRWPPTPNKSPQLRWKKFPVLNDGFVCLVDIMGDDQSVVQAARVSYGEGTRKVSDDRGLIRYLLRHRHTTPFEMAEIKLLVRVPMDCWRQWIRHRTANVNEYSTRYSLAIDAMQTTADDAWRTQAAQNRQGSGDLLDRSQGAALSAAEVEFHERARQLYEERIAQGVAREQARKDLPLSTYTEAYWKVDLHNLLHFLALRMDSHAQWRFASTPTRSASRSSSRCFRWYGKRLSTTGWKGCFCRGWSARSSPGWPPDWPPPVARQASEDDFLAVQDPSWADLTRCRERDECREKLRLLNLLASTKPIDSTAMSHAAEEEELLDLNQQLLDSIAAGDWETYQELCDRDSHGVRARGTRASDRGARIPSFLFQPGSPRGPAQYDDVVATRAGDGGRGGRDLRAAGAVDSTTPARRSLRPRKRRASGKCNRASGATSTFTVRPAVERDVEPAVRPRWTQCSDR